MIDPDHPALKKVRALCLALPDVVERLSHQTPSWFAGGKRAFAHLTDNHHGDGRLALWCAAPPGVQQTLVEADPERFFRPAYVGVRGWLGIRLDRGLTWKEVARFVEDAHATVAPRPRPPVRTKAAARAKAPALPKTTARAKRSPRPTPAPKPAAGSRARARAGRAP